MIQNLTYLKLIMFSISVGLFTSAHAVERSCGDRIQAKDVLVADLEPFVDQEDQFYEKLKEQAGDFTLITQAPIRIRSRGSVAQTTRSARESAATLGCDLVVTLGYQVVESRWEGKVTPQRWLMVHLGKRGNPRK